MAHMSFAFSSRQDGWILTVDGRIGYHFVVRDVCNVVEAMEGIHEAQGLYH